MSFILAGMVYGVMVAALVAVGGVVCLVRGKPPGWAVVMGGVVGSVVGFLEGCLAGAMVGIAVPEVRTRLGATAVVTSVGLGFALLGLMLGASAPRFGGGMA